MKNDLFEKIEQLSIEQIIGSRITLQQKGGHYYGLCPFHAASHIGAFVVTPHKNMWKCFACGENFGGNGIHFIELYDNISYKEAACKIAYEQGYISYDEYISYNENMPVSKKSEKKFPVKGKRKTVLNLDLMEKIYLCMKNACVLTDKHLHSLKEERKLETNRIDSDYFTFPHTKKERIRVLKEIRKKNPDLADNDFIKIPGFFIDRKTGKLDFYGVKGLGILIHDYNGHVVAIQIRKDSIKKGEQRYTWFSSSYQKSKPEDFIGGESSGSPHDFLFPDDNKKTNIVITEGRFKGETIRKHGNISISLQGVTTWSGIDEEIAEILKTKKISAINLAFDADMFSNISVFRQLIKICDCLKISFPFIKLRIICWRIADGKGIDDVGSNGNIKNIKYFLYDDNFVSAYENTVNTTLSSFGYDDIKHIPEDKRIEFANELQKSNEKTFLGF